MGHKKAKADPWPMPRNWMKRCNTVRGYAWCAKWIDILTEEQLIWINCGHAPRKLPSAVIASITEDCKYLKLPEKLFEECKKSEMFLSSLHKRQNYECPQVDREKGAKRAANLDSDHSGKLAVGLSLGGLLMIILLGVIAYWYFRGRQKSDRPPKGASKGGSKGGSKGASKGGKSKLGKSKLGSRKSSQRSSHKGSLRSKATKSAKKK